MRYLAKTLEYTSENPDVRLVFFGDVHDGSAYFSRRHFKQFLSESMDHPNAYLIGMGDHVDAIVPSDVKRFQLSTVDKKFLSVDNPDDLMALQAKDFVSLLLPYQNRILGLCTGNHETAITKHSGFPIHEYICEKLSCDNFGYTFLMILKLTHNEHRRVRSFTVYGTHGWGGGGRTAGGSITKYARLRSYYEADCYVTAHDHDYWIKKEARIGVNQNGNMVSKDVVLINTGAFLKTLSDGVTPSWAETKGFPPRLLGGVVLDLTPDNHGWITTKMVE